MKCVALILFLLASLSAVAVVMFNNATLVFSTPEPPPESEDDIIPSSYRMDWVPGVTVGVQGGIPTRTNLLDVTQAPYSADNTGTNDASAAIQAAINAAAANDVVYLPTGRYVLSNMVYIFKNDITLRGAGASNTVLVAIAGGGTSLKIGRDVVNYQSDITDTPTNGFMVGSTNLTLAADPVFSVGEMIAIGAFLPSSDDFHAIGLGLPAMSGGQISVVTGVSGRNITIADPLIFSMTNRPAISSFQNKANNLGPYGGIGIEDLTITGTNDLNGATSANSSLILFTAVHNSWMTGCSVLWAKNYSINISACTHMEVRRNTIRFAQSGGSNHAGLLWSACFSLIEDNIFADGLQPAIEFNGGSANAFFANFMTNNLIDIDCHGPHPLFYLWEANVLGEYPAGGGLYFGGGFELDGYFGSASHQTLFRNNITSRYSPIQLKRWSSYCAIVGNVLGNPAAAFTNFMHDINGVAYNVIELGRPNIGNNNYTGTNPPIPWNYPGSQIDNTYINGVFALTNTQVATTNLTGNFTNIIANGTANRIIFQDGANTNVYWPQDGIPIYPTQNGTTSNLFVNRSITVSNGWRVFAISQVALYTYQQLITTNRPTHIISGNYDYYNDAQTWDANGEQTLTSSYIYTNGAPVWWGTNRWPAIDPVAVTPTTPIPAQTRYVP